MRSTPRTPIRATRTSFISERRAPTKPPPRSAGEGRPGSPLRDARDDEELFNGKAYKMGPAARVAGLRFCYTETTMTLRWLIAITALLALARGAWAADEPTAKDAEAFIVRVEAELIPLNEYSARVSWIGNNFITEDTMWLQAKVRTEMTRLTVDHGSGCATFA